MALKDDLLSMEESKATQALSVCTRRFVIEELKNDSSLEKLVDLSVDPVLLTSLDEYDQIDFENIERIGSGQVTLEKGEITDIQFDLDWSLIKKR